MHIKDIKFKRVHCVRDVTYGDGQHKVGYVVVEVTAVRDRSTPELDERDAETLLNRGVRFEQLGDEATFTATYKFDAQFFGPVLVAAYRKWEWLTEPEEREFMPFADLWASYCDGYYAGRYHPCDVDLMKHIDVACWGE
jgi:hypothetical protein